VHAILLIRLAIKKSIAAIAITILVLAGCASLCPKEVSVPKNLDNYSGLSAALAAGENIILIE